MDAVIVERETDQQTLQAEPRAMMSGGLPHSCSSACVAALKTGADVSKPTAGDPPSSAKDAMQSLGRRS